ncbi:MAG: universal stress protein, partial [Pseudomonadota bacterium]
QKALHYAARRARRTGGRLALLRVLEPESFQPWMAVEALLETEARSEAERALQDAAAEGRALSGAICAFHLREGKPGEALLDALSEDAAISVLVLGADSGPKGPGPLVRLLVEKMRGRFKTPVTIVPDQLTDEEIDAIA